jgi:hypothetical protein
MIYQGTTEKGKEKTTEVNRLNIVASNRRMISRSGNAASLPPM